MKSIFLTGGSGTLGQELLKIDHSIIAPRKGEFNIESPQIVLKHFMLNNVKKIDVFVHAAAYTDQVNAELFPKFARNINILGTINIVNLCEDLNLPLVYISTSYVFDGKNPPYNTNSPINPLNIYSMTKAAGEFVVKSYKNSMIIRTSFLPVEFTYEHAAVDQFTNRDYIDIIAPLIYKECINFRPGIFHIGTERKSMFELAKKRSKYVKKMFLKELPHIVPEDISFEEQDKKFI